MLLMLNFRVIWVTLALGIFKLFLMIEEKHLKFILSFNCVCEIISFDSKITIVNSQHAHTN